MTRVLIVDDTATVRSAIRRLLAEDSDVVVVAEGCDGAEAVDLTRRHRPDIVLMDVDMPRMDGLAATAQIMSEFPTPILIVTSSTILQARQVPFAAIEAGALEVLPKPNLASGSDWDGVSAQLLQKVRVLSRVRVVRRRRGASPVSTMPEAAPASEPQPPKKVRGLDIVAGWLPEVIVIGASTGGPMCLRRIIREIPAGFPVPIALVQHIGDEFVPGLAEWLGQNASVPVVLARNGEPVRPGTVVVAPGGVHIRLEPGHVVRFDRGPRLHHCKPAVDVLFHSAAKAFRSRVVAVLLTGMGRDGADGMRAIKQGRGLTIAQDEESSTVYGMPGAAVELGAVDQIMAPAEIGQWLAELPAAKTAWNEGRGEA